MTAGIGQSVAKGALWMVLFKVVERSIGLLSTIVLARLLIPSDFGLVALAMAIIALLEVLGYFSFDIVLIQRQQADRSYYDTAWTFNVVVGVSTSLILLAIAAPAAAFYNEPRLETVVQVLALAPFFNGLENIGIVAFRKELKFHKEFAFLLTKKLLSFTVTLTLALLLRSYWALIAGIVTSRVTGTLLSYWVHPYRPRISLSRRRELFHFSSWMFVGNVVAFVNSRVSDFVVGKIGGSHSLGLYSVAYEVSNLPTTELVAPINRAVFPGYAKLGGNVGALRTGYLTVVGMIALVTIPAALGIAATASVFVPLVLGPKWIEAVAVINVLAFFGLLQALQGNTGSVYFALGRPKINTYIVTIYSAIMVPALIVGTLRAGSVGAATALLVSNLIILPVNLGTVFKHLEVTVRSFVSVIWRSASAGSAMFAVVSMLKQQLGASTNTFDQLIALLTLIGAGALTYVATVLALWFVVGRPEGAEGNVLAQLRQRFKRGEAR